MDTLSLDFMNSDWRDYRGSGRRADRLRSPAWVDEFVATWKLDVVSPLRERDIDMLTELREALWRIVRAIGRGASPARRDLEAVNQALASSPRVPYVAIVEGGFEMSMAPTKHDWDWVRSEIAADFARLLTEHEPGRIKTCENGDCLWVFFDESKSQNRRWCATVCSNLIRVRRFRDRQRNA